MDQAPHVRVRRTLPLLGMAIGLALGLSACVVSNEETAAIIVANRDACAGFGEEINHLNSLADASPTIWADAIDDVAVSFADRAQRAADPSTVRSSFLLAADAFTAAADRARETGVLADQELEGVNNTLHTVETECRKFTG